MINRKRKKGEPTDFVSHGTEEEHPILDTTIYGLCLFDTPNIEEQRGPLLN